MNRGGCEVPPMASRNDPGDCLSWRRSPKVSATVEMATLTTGYFSDLCLEFFIFFFFVLFASRFFGLLQSGILVFFCSVMRLL